MCVGCMQHYYLMLQGALSLHNINSGEPSLLYFFIVSI